MAHLIFYDSSCPLCERAISFIYKRDKKKQFYYSSLDGKTAGSFCNTIQILDYESIVLIENFQTQKQEVYYKSKALFKILWNLGGLYKLIGWKYILPSFVFDWAYNLIAKNRKTICKKLQLTRSNSIPPKQFKP